ncbi:oligosaccharide flippase family protein [Neobacillus sp. YIM B06451]|uniref:lipopolysaccharide biosynthesis protein n=1 Tax=Neobacillus sp. YIM B06451 TaxID=3070994 RepID=UPI00292F5D5F|nr:oligosaccharide flippase family protein [Neobacillus sp. YIM B06451]
MKSFVVKKIDIKLRDSLSKTVSINTLYTLFFKILTVIISFWSIKVAFEFTGSQKSYGLWLTILSVLSWINLVNGGISNGLRNKLAEALAKKQVKNAKEYVSTSYAFIIFISLFFCLLFTLVSLVVDWRTAFNASFLSQSDFQFLILTLIISYFIQLIFTTVHAISLAFNRSMLPTMFMFISNAIFMIALYILGYYNIKGILVLGITYSFSNIVVLLIANVFLFRNQYKEIKPDISMVKIKYVKDLMNTGIKFFLLEIFAVIIFSSDSIVITHTVGNNDVATYQLVLKLFSVFTIISSSVMIPLWSAYTHAYSKGDLNWIKTTLSKNIIIFFPFGVGILLFSLSINSILKFWLGGDVVASEELIWMLAIYTIISIWCNIFAYFLNGINKITGQLITVGAGAITNIPLSIYLGQYLNLGSPGVILGTIICLLPFAILGPIESYLHIKRKT